MVNVSACCKANIVIEYDSDRITYEVCSSCGKVCETVPEEVVQGLKEAKEGKVFTNTKEYKKYKTTLRKNWTCFDWLEHWWYIYFWNYVSNIPLEIRSFIQRGIRGYSDRDTWDFDRHLAEVIEGGCKRLLKDNQMGDKKYVADLRTIIKTMKLAQKITCSYRVYYSKEEWQTTMKEFRKGMKALTRRFFQLWD
jgi:hypothetical protein